MCRGGGESFELRGKQNCSQYRKAQQTVTERVFKLQIRPPRPQFLILPLPRKKSAFVKRIYLFVPLPITAPHQRRWETKPNGGGRVLMMVKKTICIFVVFCWRLPHDNRMMNANEIWAKDDAQDARETQRVRSRRAFFRGSYREVHKYVFCQYTISLCCHGRCPQRLLGITASSKWPSIHPSIYRTFIGQRPLRMMYNKS